jgi:uncharacterized lipoprotein YddW (UPF0748 family)
MRIWLTSLIFCILAIPAIARDYAPSRESPPRLAQEFRAVWVATIYNIDWPSRPGLSAAAQQAEMRTLLDRLVQLRMNAIILQVRAQCDAAYQSKLEPWSSSFSGTMGRSPGYDPLAFTIREAHARGIEVHAWFNPFRALSNNSQQTASNHISRTSPNLTKRYGNMTWLDPANSAARRHALNVILDVVRRYDIDGVHIDDYFYPYPSGNLRFPDGLSPAQRRGHIDSFVRDFYQSVKREKSWVRVGISPFGIWRPGVPAGIEAGIDSVEQLAGDSRKWLKEGWVDYLAPQLYWRIQPEKQSFPKLLEWWRQQGSRPVWPGIATSRIQSREDPGRTAAEITNQIDLTRRIGRNWNGHIHWSAEAIIKNRGGINNRLTSSYTNHAAVPPMPWVNRRNPPDPSVSATLKDGNTEIHWRADNRAAKVAVQVRNGRQWNTVRILPAGAGKFTVPRADAVAITAIDRTGNLSSPVVVSIR